MLNWFCAIWLRIVATFIVMFLLGVICSCPWWASLASAGFVFSLWATGYAVLRMN